MALRPLISYKKWATSFVDVSIPYREPHRILYNYMALQCVISCIVYIDTNSDAIRAYCSQTRALYTQLTPTQLELPAAVIAIRLKLQTSSHISCQQCNEYDIWWASWGSGGIWWLLMEIRGWQGTSWERQWETMESWCCPDIRWGVKTSAAPQPVRSQ